MRLDAYQCRFGGVALLLLAWGTVHAQEPQSAEIPLHVRIDALVDSAAVGPINSPASDADFLRRVSLDLTGVIPTATAARAFLADESPEKRTQLIDRLLASPAYGERWGRHWLDVTYWADTTGSGRRIPLRDAWRYRDYVIQAFNEDKPYDRFIQEQIAGPAGKSSDEKAPPPTPEEQAATGFLVLGPWAWIS